MMTTDDTIRKAIEVLGRPVMAYQPQLAIKEYDAKIAEAVELLLSVISPRS